MIATPAENPQIAESGLRKALHLGLTLFCVTAITGLVLGAVEQGTRDAILRARQSDRAYALLHVMPGADSFKPGDTAQPPNDDASDIAVIGVDAALKGPDRIGWCVTVRTRGYGGPVTLIAGIANDGSLRAIRILTHSETPGLGARSTEPEFYNQFNDKTQFPLSVTKGSAAAADEISAISGATITSNAVTAGVNAAESYWRENLNGR